MLGLPAAKQAEGAVQSIPEQPLSGGISTAPTVTEGGTITVEVEGDARSISIGVPGVGRVEVPVENGVAEYTLPASVPAGTKIIVSDNDLPDPSTATVTVVGTQ
jgi:hypothetical protein